MTVNEVLDILNGTKRLEPEDLYILNKWRNLYYGMSLHTSGAAPAFVDLSNKPFIIPQISGTMGYANAEYGNYLRTLGFDYNGYWIFPANWQGWEYHFIFDKIIFNRHPRESEDTRQWRFSQYVPITKSPCGQLNDVVIGAIFQDSNYRIEIEDKTDNEYIWGNNFMGYDIGAYMANVFYKSQVEDANGYLLRIPKKPFYEQPQNSKPEVDLWFIYTKELCIPPTEDEILFKKYGYGWYINREAIYRFKFNRESKKYESAGENKDAYYSHLLGRLPISKAGGEWNTHGYYESWYYKAKPIMDDILRSWSQRQLVDKEASTPKITEVSVDCPACDGVGKVNGAYDSETGALCTETCTKCNGSGSRPSDPAAHLYIDKKDWNDVNPGYVFTNPDVSVNKNARETIDGLMVMILEAMNLNKNKTDTVQSGLAKAIDRENLYKFVSKVSNNIFDKIVFDTLTDIIAYRNVSPSGSGVKPKAGNFIIDKPTQFQILTGDDLLVKLKTANEAGTPSAVVERIVLDYVRKDYAGDKVMQKKISYIAFSNPLFVKTTTDIQTMSAMLPREQITYNEMISVWLDEIIEEKGQEWFVAAPYKIIKVEVDKKVSAYEALYGEELDAAKEPNTEVIDENKQVTI